MSPGSAFMLPHGAIIYNKLVQFIRDEYRVRGYTEVVTPNMYNANLWKISGHWDKYQQNMFVVKMEDEGTEKNVQYGLKPMNCPGHCLMFDMSLYSYRDLPIRFADFGVLHRNELHGALTGLTRVRRFQQDDAHIFCTADQIMDEVMNTLDFIQHCYKIFGFEFNLELSTKPENAIGDQQLWDKAEAALIEALNKFGRPWKINPGDGAFYGPKIDIKIFDSLKREHQCGTVQLDFNNPIRFNLQYRSSEDDCKKQEGTAEPGLKPGFARPIMIHRAVLGSVERMLAILCEHTGGKWPFWVSPRQVKVIPISEKFKVYAEQIHNRLILEGFCSEIDHSNDTINKKVRNAQLEQFNYMAVVGEKEQEAGTVNLRNRDEKDPIGVLNMNQLLQLFKSLSPEPSQARLAVEKNSFKCTGQNHLNELNNELQLKTFLNGEGFELGPRDQETFESLKDQDISQFPNIQRWYAYLKQKQQ